MKSLRFSITAFLVSVLLLTLPLLTLAQSGKEFSKVTPGNTTALRVVSGDPTRSSVLVQNVGGVNVALGGSTVTYATGMILLPNQQMLCVGDTDALWAIAQSGTADLRVTATFSRGAGRPPVLPSCTVTRLASDAEREAIGTTEKTVATTGNTDAYVVVPEAGTLVSADFSGIDALAASDTNFITFSITNLGQAGAGSTVMLAATNANTTRVTGGTALVANGRRSLTVTATGADLVVAQGDRLRIRYAATGTLANTVTGGVMTLRFSFVN